VNGWPRSRVSRAQASGIGALLCAVALSSCEPLPFPLGLLLAPSALPLTAFIAVCVAAPFFPSWSFFLPIVSHGPRDRAAVALSFDDGPDPATTPALLDLLARHGAQAAFFVIGRNAEKHPELMERIRAAGHEVGNHSMSHDPILMLRSAAVLETEIAHCQAILVAQGIQPLAFRPPVGITNPRLVAVLTRLGLGCVCFSCRPADFGNRRVAGLSERVLRDAGNGDIVLLHDVAPQQGVAVEAWLKEIEAVIGGLRSRGLELVPISELIGLPLMALQSGERATVRPAHAEGT
jgi:peptidoglycan/xylan/chitin deacetylase (PgdA/CDA1 family)